MKNEEEEIDFNAETSTDSQDDEVEEYTEEVEDEGDWTTEDTMFLGGVCSILLVLFICVCRIIKKTFKNVHVKIGALEIGVETKAE